MLWKDEKFDLLLKEACRCDRALCRSKSPKIDEEGVIRVFTKIMLRGKVRAAVHWATERFRGCVLNPNDTIDGGETVFDILQSKHPPASAPTK